MLERFATGLVVWLLDWLVSRSDSGILKHFNFEASRFLNDDDYYQNIRRIIVLFAMEGHSGGSASYAINTLSRALRYQPLSPLTGSDDEWLIVGEENGIVLYQNVRCSTIFKRGANGVAYNIDGFVFKDTNGRHYTDRYSRRYINFPWDYTEPVIIVDDGLKKFLHEINSNKEVHNG